MGQIRVQLDPLPHVPISHATNFGIWSGPPPSFWDNVLKSVFFILKASLREGFKKKVVEFSTKRGCLVILWLIVNILSLDFWAAVGA